MKILCVSDQIDPVVYSASIKEHFRDVDLILSAGDLPMDYLDFIVSSLNKPLLFVSGNHDRPDHEGGPPGRNGPAPPGAGLIHVGARVKREEGLIIAGLGGSMRYNRGGNQYTNFEMTLMIGKLIPALLLNRIFRGRFLDILLTHAAPEGIHDLKDLCHRGFRPFLWFMRVFKPRYLIHGHIHLYDIQTVRVTRYRETTVLNAYGHYLIDTGAAP
ncbi:MAG: metallophosphoesterase [Spirochaetaceae bacterium]|jgi:Icc-related predicted phosphoesterase|nr:metallophosphoesterase [Spirochaetaceae bacterium]